jgi:hypothetical protein
VETGNQDLNFHYNREDRFKLAGKRYGEPSEQGFFVRYRSLLIVFLDIVLVSIIFLVFFVFLRPDPATAEMEGYRFRLRAVMLANDIWITVSVDAVSEITMGETIFTVNDGIEETITELLPRENASTRYVRIQRSVGENEPVPSEVTVQIGVGEKEVTLTAPVQDEG